MVHEFTLEDLEAIFAKMHTPRPVQPKAKPSVIIQLASYEGRKHNEGDCSIRALAVFLDVPYAEAKELVLAHMPYNQRTGVGMIQYGRLMASLGLKFVQAQVRLNSKNAKDKLPTKAILLFARHVAAYENGVITDVFSTTNVAGCKQTKGYWTYA